MEDEEEEEAPPEEADIVVVPFSGYSTTAKSSKWRPGSSAKSGKGPPAPFYSVPKDSSLKGPRPTPYDPTMPTRPLSIKPPPPKKPAGIATHSKSLPGMNAPKIAPKGSAKAAPKAVGAAKASRGKPLENKDNLAAGCLVAALPHLSGQSCQIYASLTSASFLFPPSSFLLPSLLAGPELQVLDQTANSGSKSVLGTLRC